MHKGLPPSYDAGASICLCITHKSMVLYYFKICQGLGWTKITDMTVEQARANLSMEFSQDHVLINEGMISFVIIPSLTR